MQFSPQYQKIIKLTKICLLKRSNFDTNTFVFKMLFARKTNTVVGVAARPGHSRTSYAYDWKESSRSNESGTAMFTEYAVRLRIRHLQLLVKEKLHQICLRFSSELFLFYNQGI